MGSAPSSSSNKKKDIIDVVEITAQQKLSQDQSNNINKKQSPIFKIQNKTNPNNKEQFKTSVQQMKYSKRNDLFKQKSKQTMIQLNNALSSLKKNQLLSTAEFKRLQKTQQMAPSTLDKSPVNGQKKDRYHYKKATYKRSQLAVRQKRTQSSINVSSLTSTYINEGKVIGNSNEHNCKKHEQDKRFTKQQQVIKQLSMKKRQNNKQKQKVLSQNANYQKQYQAKQVQQLDIVGNGSLVYEQINSKRVDSITNNSNNAKKKKNKFIRSEKFINNKLSDGAIGYWDQGVIVLDEIQQS